MKYILSFLFLATSSWAGVPGFRINDFNDTNTLNVVYPPEFDGAFLVLEQCTDLINQTWEPTEACQVSWEELAQLPISPPSTNASPISSDAQPEYADSIDNPRPFSDKPPHRHQG